ncbi:transport protein [Klebsiella pneumoniae]|uniref:Transport protein n=1 Tax=Klebsiella pneumoniae TaxID=573 RepID=A0A2X3C106_KLEPN|nr:transport protein [Klebsiella pneumoniae]
MVISFISVVPFIIYAEVKRKMKRVFLLCVAILLIAEIVLWGARRLLLGAGGGRSALLPGV